METAIVAYTSGYLLHNIDVWNFNLVPILIIVAYHRGQHGSHSTS